MTDRDATDVNKSIGANFAVIAAAVFLVAIAWAMYRPDRVRPFDILDFGEFLPLVKRTGDFTEQVASVTRYNAAQSGRANLVPTLAAVLKWRLFGGWTPGWQLTHASIMLAVMLQTYLLLRRFGSTRVGGVIAASTYLVAPAASRAWVRLTVGEPLGMVVVLALALRARHFQRATKWGREVVLFSAGAVIVLLVKEMMAPVLLLPLALAVTREPDGTFARPRLTRRNVTLAVSMGIASMATLVPLLLLYLHASASALASQYGRSLKGPADVLAIWIATLVPFNPVPYPVSIMWILAVVAFTTLLAIGWRIGLKDPGEGRRARCLLAGALFFPLVGALAYVPWPTYEARYAFPYLAGTSLLVGMAASYAERRTSGGVRWALLVWGVVLVFAAGEASAHASRADAVQRETDAVISVVAGLRDVDSVVVATAQAFQPEWTGLGPTLNRLAGATDRPWPPTHDIRCEQAAERIRSPHRLAVVIFSSQCRNQAQSTRSVVARYRRVEWSRWSIVPDSVSADLFQGAGSLDATSRPQRD